MTRPVLILGDDARVALTIARSLHRRGVPVDAASLSATAPRMNSRALRDQVRLPGDVEQPERFRDALLALLEERPYEVIFPSSDTALCLVSAHHEELSRRLLVGCPPPEVVRRALDKDVTIEIARTRGIDVPSSFAIADAAALEALGGSLRFPIVAKGRTKAEMHKIDFKVRYFGSHAELSEAFRAQPDLGGQVLFQEYCLGSGVGIGMLVHRGERIAAFQHRRLKELPSTGGVGVVAVSEALDPELSRAAMELLRGMEWDGVAMVEFRDARPDGRAVLMEVNGRFWGSCSLAVQSGVDFPYYYWQLLRGERPEVPAGYAVGRRWRWTSGHVQRFVTVFSEPSIPGLPPVRRWREALGTIRDFGPGTHSSLWSAGDPRPAVEEVTRTVMRLGKTAAKLGLRRVLPRALRDRVKPLLQLGRRERREYVRAGALRAVGLRGVRPSASALRASRTVLFICHGNIMRSPMAAALLAQALARAGLDGVEVVSAGLHGRPGRPADRRAQEIARELGITLDDHRSQPLTGALVAEADLIFVMDLRNEAELLARFPEARRKVFLLGGSGGSRPEEIADPYERDPAEVRRSFALVRSHVDALAARFGGGAREAARRPPAPR